MRRIVLALLLSAGVGTGCATVQKESRLVLWQGGALLESSVEEPALLEQAIPVFVCADAEGTIKQLDEHIKKVEKVCPSGVPDPKNPKHRDVNHWKKEIRAFVKNLQQELKRMPKNKVKRKPVEDAIKRGEDALARWSRS